MGKTSPLVFVLYDIRIGMLFALARAWPTNVGSMLASTRLNLGALSKMAQLYFRRSYRLEVLPKGYFFILFYLKHPSSRYPYFPFVTRGRGTDVMECDSRSAPKLAVSRDPTSTHECR